MHALILILEYVVVFAILFGIVYFGFDWLFRSKGYKGAVSDHFDGTHFYSIGMSAPSAEKKEEKDEDRGGMIKWLFNRRRTKWEERKIRPTIPETRIEKGKTVITFINHATVLIQTAGLNILTDPHFGKRASPVSFVGPKRHANPGVDFDKLPPIDIVLLSHNHYDHLDIGTVRRLHQKFRPKFLVPLGNRNYLEKKGINVLAEMDWWDKEKVDDTVFTFVPAQHFAARAISDRNKSLWGGFIIETPETKIYFAGDTGYGAWVETIREKYPDGFDFGILPIGAYLPTFMMEEVHVSPDQAWHIKDKLRIKQAMAIHFGTFKLADDGQDEPANRLEALAKEKGDNSFFAFENGGSYDF